MTETKFILFTLVYTAIAAVFTFQVGPDMVKGSREIDGSVFEFDEISRMHLKLKKEHEGSKYVFNSEVYDSLPSNIILDTTKRKVKYLSASIKIDTFTLDFNFDIEAKKEIFRNFLDVLNDAELVDKNNFKKDLPKRFDSKDLVNIGNIKIVLESKNYFSNPNNYVEIKGKKIQGYNIGFRKVIATISSYLVWFLSIICLFLIPYSGCEQLKTYHKNGIEPFVPNRTESIKNFFNLFSRNKK